MVTATIYVWSSLQILDRFNNTNKEIRCKKTDKEKCRQSSNGINFYIEYLVDNTFIKIK